MWFNLNANATKESLGLDKTVRGFEQAGQPIQLGSMTAAGLARHHREMNNMKAVDPSSHVQRNDPVIKAWPTLISECAGCGARAAGLWSLWSFSAGGC
jgi:hypothetical protein